MKSREIGTFFMLIKLCFEESARGGAFKIDS